METRQRRKLQWRLALLLMLALGAQAQTPEPAAELQAQRLQSAQAALAAGDAAQARDLFESLLEAQPDLFEARLGLGRAYLALGEYARATLELESVLYLDDLPHDLHGQADAYAQAAQRYLQGERLGTSAHLRLSAGHYSPDYRSGEYFAALRGAAGLTYQIDPANAFNASVEARHRFNQDSGNPSSLRGRVGFTHSVGKHQTHFELTSRRSRDIDGYRFNDHALSAEWRYHADKNNQWLLGTAWSQASFPEDALSQLNRNHRAGQLSLGFEHSLGDGDASIALNALWGREWGRRGGGIDGDADFHGLDGEFQTTLSDSVSFWIGGAWRHNRFSRPRANGDAPDLVVRSDDLYEAFAGLAWQLPQDWSLEPEVLYLRDRGNIAANHYSSTEVSISLRKDF